MPYRATVACRRLDTSCVQSAFYNADGLSSRLVDWPLLAQIGVFFAKAGAFVFGSGLAIVPFLYAGVVHDHACVLAGRSIVDVITALIALVTVAVIWRFKKLPEPVIVGLAAAIGLLAHSAMHR